MFLHFSVETNDIKEYWLTSTILHSWRWALAMLNNFSFWKFLSLNHLVLKPQLKMGFSYAKQLFFLKVSFIK